MIIEKGRVSAPEIGRVWLNSPPLNLRQLRGKIVLIDFWDYTSLSSVRTLPYVQEWHRRYAAAGLVVIGVHTPEFTFAQQEANVESGVREFGLTYPVVLDSDYELWKAFANRYLPAKYLIDHAGFIRFAHFGEGGYVETEQHIQALLREGNSSLRLPRLMKPLRDADTPGAVCFRATPDLHLGHKHKRIGNPASSADHGPADYDFTGELREGLVYLRGKWTSTAEYVELVGKTGSATLRYSADTVSAVLSPGENPRAEVELQQDGKPLASPVTTADTTTRRDRSIVVVDTSRIFSLVNNQAFGSHRLDLNCSSPGLRLYVFGFTSCVDPTVSGTKSA